jgi:hypothetical protein
VGGMMDDKNENNFTIQVYKLIRELEDSKGIKDKGLAEKAEKTRLERQRFEKSLASLQESLDYLRICVKYLIFDLEATKRETEYLRKLLERRDEGDENEEI